VKRGKLRNIWTQQMQWRESTECFFYEIIDNILHHLPACFSKTKSMDFFGLLICEKFDACKLKCIFPDQFLR